MLLDAFGDPVPAAWLVLQGGPVLVRLVKPPEAGDPSVEGSIKQVLWMESPSGLERHLVVATTSSPAAKYAIPESNISYVQASYAMDVQDALWIRIGRSLAMDLDHASVVAGESRDLLPVVATLQGSGREVIQIAVQRSAHDCVPGPRGSLHRNPSIA